MSPDDVVYEVVPGVPGRYFRCTRYGLMNVDACSANFKAAPRVFSEGRLAGCVGCLAGAHHSGSAMVEACTPAVMVCARCRRDPTDDSQYRSTRTGRVRMVRNGLLCVSCFNREREVLLGRNARRTKPRDLVLHEVTVGHIVDGKLSVSRLAAVKDAVEGALTVMHRSGNDSLVVWVGRGILRKKKGKRHDLESHRPLLQLLLWPNP